MNGPRSMLLFIGDLLVDGNFCSLNIFLGDILAYFYSLKMFLGDILDTLVYTIAGITTDLKFECL